VRAWYALALLAAGGLTGCATGPIGAHQSSNETVQSLRHSSMAPASVGEFVPAADLPAGRDKSVSVRGSTLSSPSSGSFAAYLKDALVSDLRSAGKYDAGSGTVISGQLTHNELNAGGMSTANSTLAAKFTVRREGATVFEKLISETREWESSFMGAIAIPNAINNYTEMYSRLLKKFYDDEEVKAALAAK
jgi:hypothetical protein